MKKLGRVLKKLRMIYGDNAKEFSNKLNISPSYLSEIENEKKDPSIELLTKYSEILNLDVSTIFLLSEDKNEMKDTSRTKRLIKPLMNKVMDMMSKE